MPSKEIVLENSLQSFFYDQLQLINHRSQLPLKNELIFYSSQVMDGLSDPKKYFELIDGKLHEKLLGPKFLKADQLAKSKKRSELKDVGDTALIICGLFPESINKKIIDLRYYQQLGKMAYKRLDGLIPDFLNVASFYNILSNSFENLTNLMSAVAENFKDATGSGQVIWMANTKLIKAS